MPHHNEKPRAVWPPEPGFFRMRLVPQGWKVPCRIVRTEIDGTYLWQTVVNGELSAISSDPVAVDVDRIWHHGSQIEEHEFWYLEALRDTAPPDHPARNPRKPIDPALLTPLAPRNS